MSARILLVEDEPAIVRAVSYVLRGEAYAVDVAETGEQALALASETEYDVVILDLMLPRIPGTEVCRRLRQRSAVPIVMLTARAGEVERIVGLEIGADDYVTKPFSVAELVARVRALLRRRELDRPPGDTAVSDVGGIHIDRGRHEVTVDGRRVELTPSEFKLLALLAEEPERVFSRREVMERLWASEHVGDGHACDVHVSKLRRKIERDPRVPERLVTVRGAGFKLLRV